MARPARPKLAIVEKPEDPALDNPYAHPVEPTEPESLPAEVGQPFADVTKTREFGVEVADIAGTNGYIHVAYRVTAENPASHEDSDVAVAAFIRRTVESWKERLTK